MDHGTAVSMVRYLLKETERPFVQLSQHSSVGSCAAWWAVQADLATLKGVDGLHRAASGRPIDVLCANAGHGLGKAFLDQEFTDVRRVIDTNITGTIYLIHKSFTKLAQICDRVDRAAL
jgi:short-subunit dehydrogenase